MAPIATRTALQSLGRPLAAFDFVFRTYTFINSPPTDITLDNNTVDENDAGAVIGKLTATDPDPGDTHIFTVDDARFEVDTADNLKLLDGVSLDFETEASVDIDVTATDAGGLGFTKMFTILVNDLADVVVDTTPPTLTVPADITVEGDTNSGALATNATIAAFLGAAAANDVVDPSPDITNDAPALFLVGPTTVTFTATDDDGNFATAQATVIVVDTTPPALGEPDDITVVIESLAGTVVTYALPTATDIVDPDPAVDCLPAAGSTFGLGPTVVECTATDDSSNSAMTTFTVTVLGPRDLKLEAIELLAPYAGESKEIAKAVKYIEKSLGDRLWDDDLHLDAKRGDKVFTLERKAVKKLSKLLKSRKDGDSDDDESSDDDRRHGRQASDEAKTAAAAAIDLLVDADRILADLIIQEAEAATPLDPKRQKKIDRKIAKANKQLAKGDADLAAGKPDKAIKHYRKAWESANSALKHAQKAPKHRRGRDRDDDDDDD